jgi:hypothetical protein
MARDQAMGRVRRRSSRRDASSHRPSVPPLATVTLTPVTELFQHEAAVRYVANEVIVKKRDYSCWPNQNLRLGPTVGYIRRNNLTRFPARAPPNHC